MAGERELENADNPQINVEPQQPNVLVGYERLAWFLSVSGYLQNDNSRSFADILASRGGEGDKPPGWGQPSNSSQGRGFCLKRGEAGVWSNTRHHAKISKDHHILE